MFSSLACAMAFLYISAKADAIGEKYKMLVPAQ